MLCNSEHDAIYFHGRINCAKYQQEEMTVVISFNTSIINCSLHHHRPTFHLQ